jgi:hypothetical protein
MAIQYMATPENSVAKCDIFTSLWHEIGSQTKRRKQTKPFVRSVALAPVNTHKITFTIAT